MLAEPSTIILFGLGLFVLTLLAVTALVCVFAIRAKRWGGTIFDFAFGKMREKKNPAPPVVPSTQIIPRKCPQCGAELKPDVPEGLCPACLLQRGIATEGGAPPGTQPFVPPTIPELAKLFPQLEILELIGKGGMGAVYKARQPALDRFVALKILAPRSGDDRDFAERFTREARALAKLSHPNIVGVYDFGRAELPLGQDAPQRVPTTPIHYFIMEYVDGPNLRQIEQAGKLSPREALEIIPQICAALQFAHDEGIVHRDIKPENVLLDKKGRVKIADFGLAKILGQEPNDFRLTGARDVVGTPHYMAPEQVEKPQEVDHRADIYSLGVVFYEMLTGELPLGKFQPPSQRVQVDVRLDEVVLHALEKEPSRRYQQASQVKTAVETIARSTTPLSEAQAAEKSANQLPTTAAAPAISFALSYACLVAYLAYSAQWLPERVASHFGLDFNANSWMPRPVHLVLIGIVPLLFVGVFSALRLLPLPAGCFNLPHREYWLSPERRAGTVAFIFRQGLWFACLVTGFMAGIQYLIVQANTPATAHLAAAPFLFLIMGFLLATMIFVIQLMYRFAAPDPRKHSTQVRENITNKPLTFGIIITVVCLLTGLAVWYAAQPSVASPPAAPPPPALPKAEVTASIPGWFPAGSNPNDYTMARDRNTTHGGKASAYVKSIVPRPGGFGTLMQSFKADAYCSRRVRLSGFLRSEDVRNWAGLWMRVDGAKGEVLAFDNMQDRAVKGTTDWTRYEIVLDVPEAGQQIAMGLILDGPGQVWMDDLKIEVVGKEVAPTGGTRVSPTPQLEFTN